jgi:hypothetical protein
VETASTCAWVDYVISNDVGFARMIKEDQCQQSGSQMQMVAR